MFFKQIFDNKLAQYSYIVGCQANGTAIIIDPMRDVDQYFTIAADEKLEIIGAADTHIHADYVSGLREMAERGVKVYASDEGDKDWKYEWLKGSDYDYQLLTDGDVIRIGNIEIKAWYTPGHTPEHLSFFITDGAAANEPMGVASGDFVFVGDVGRPDLLESAAGMENMMESSARTLFKTVEKFKSLPEYIQVWPGHGSGSACGKALGAVPKSTVGYELKYNNSIQSSDSEKNFVDFILEGQPEPPYYFARMKQINKEGQPLVSDSIRPVRLGIHAFLDKVQKDDKAVILDTRSAEDFMEGHLPKSMLSPFNKQFNTIAGSYIEADQPIYLVIQEHDVDEAVRDLIRVGLDFVPAYITPDDLKNYDGELDQIEVLTFDDVDKGVKDGKKVLDVRKLTEYQEGHIEGAINVAHTRLLPRLNEVPSDTPLMVHCKAGSRSAVATGFLAYKGYEVSVVLDEFANYPTPEYA
jgi:hydroxyacylglutathione hydrolase